RSSDLLSVPRDIDERIKVLDDVFLYSVDDLEKVITENMNRRQDTVAQARRIIDAEVELYMQWLQRKKYHNLLRQLQDRDDNDKRLILLKQQHQDLSEDTLQKMEILAHQVSKKIAHPSISGLRKVIESGNVEHIKLLAQVFELDIDNDT